MSNDFYEGFKDLSNELDNYIQSVENIDNNLEEGAKAFVTDARKLPKPISKIKKSGYTHLIDTITYRKIKNEIEVGWGKYYGPMVENGTAKMTARPHLNPLWEKNEEKYYEIITNKIFN